MDEDEIQYTIEGTTHTYTEWAEAVLDIHIKEGFQRIDFSGEWSLEMAFMNDTLEGFTAGYRVITDLPTTMYFEVTWNREDTTTVLETYLMINKDIIASDEPPAQQQSKAQVSCGNYKANRF